MIEESGITSPSEEISNIPASFQRKFKWNLSGSILILLDLSPAECA